MWSSIRLISGYRNSRFILILILTGKGGEQQRFDTGTLYVNRTYGACPFCYDHEYYQSGRQDVSSSTQVAGSDWPNGRILPAFQAPQHLDVYTIRHAPQDIQLSVSTLVGLINRSQPKVYLITSESDLFWFNEVFTAIPHDVFSTPANEVLEA